MTKEKLNILMKSVDKTKKPRHWRKFINENTIGHNLILKCGKKFFCTHCRKYFDEEIKVHSYAKAKCPVCEHEYYIRNNNVKNYTYVKDIGFYTKIDGNIVLRIFEIESRYDKETKRFKHRVQEYARFIPKIGTVINNSVYFCMGNMKIYHNIRKIKWHIYTGTRYLPIVSIYPFDKRRLFKNTVYEYAPIDEFKKKFKRYDELEVLQIAGYESFELLWKMGLYKLSIYAKYFNKKGSFQQRFGVPKSFLKFMVDNDLAYDEYKILKLLQEPNYELIQQYRKYDYNYLVFMKKQNCLKDLDVIEKFKNCEKTLRNICKYVPLRKFLSYEKGVKNIQIYSDYLSMLKQLNYKMKCRKELFPKQLIASHNKVMKKLKFIQDVQSHYGVYLRFLELSKYIYEDDNYIIFPAQSIDAMKDESEQQGNCVGYLYIKPYIDKKTEIFFIRKVNDVTKSFITLEFKDGVVAQKELPNHGREFSKGQIEFIDKWIKYRLFVDKKERYKCKKVDRIIKYELNKLAV